MNQDDNVEPSRPLFDDYKPKTTNGYSLDEVASTIQKAIRRGDEETALFFALELFPRYAGYAFRRLSVIAVEDIESPMAVVYVDAMAQSFFRNNDKKKADEYKNRIFITKAVLSLCREVKSREADHAQKYIDQIIESHKLPKIPAYSFDVHTKKGRMAGQTKDDFFRVEQEGLDVKGRDDYYAKLK